MSEKERVGREGRGRVDANGDESIPGGVSETGDPHKERRAIFGRRLNNAKCWSVLVG